MADLSTAIVPVEGRVANDRSREYRKGNWTLDETMVLIAGKKLDDERRSKGGEKEKGRSAEFRWKWVENYCWNNNCQRSQNQCNDKWDNLLRDYKKVRDHETRIEQGQRLYWQLEKHERKEKGLPSNLLIQIYDALHDIVDKRLPARAIVTMAPASEKPCPSQLPALPSNPPPASADVSKTSASEGSDVPSSPAKKRRLSSTTDGLVSAVSRSTSDLSQTLLACEEKRDKRHKDLLGVEERKLILEQSRAEVDRQGIEALIGAVNNLASAIMTLAADHK
ncbi:hypothetical protein O6H91_05G041800 [Diphasiastrum complanatum]|uniref:Uncharacterized protein n=1 Tax=Diphasiastrum complanatum TaxID=34168 RepID=A0ACC2DMS9_DIPCM|nr:hypothetical protein O6H91_05G041800 [Diphasiastrum complanatum]